MTQDAHAGGPLSERDLSLLSAYLDDELSEAERAQLEARLKTDAGLQAELELLRRTVALVRSLPSVPPPRNFTLDPTRYGRRAASPRWLSLAMPMMAAGASLLLVAMCAGVVLLSGAGLRGAAAPLASQAQEVAEVEVAEEEAPAAEFAAPAEEEEAAPAAEAEEEEKVALEAEEPAGAAPAEELAPQTAAPAAEAEALDEAAAKAAETEGEAQPQEEAIPPQATPQAGPAATLEAGLLQATQSAERAAPAGEVVAPPAVPAPAGEVAPPAAQPALQTPRRRFIIGLVIGVAAVLGVALLGAGVGLSLAARRR